MENLCTQTFAGYQTAGLRAQNFSFRQNLACNTGKTLNAILRKSLISNGGSGKSLLTPTKNQALALINQA